MGQFWWIQVCAPVIYTLIKFIFGKNDFLSDKNCISQKYKKNC